jgi:hypothetical protein
MPPFRTPVLSAAAASALVLGACVDVVQEPLSPPPAGLTVTLRDSAFAGELTWIAVERPVLDTGAIRYESSDPSVVAVDPDGRVFPFRSGSVTITVRSPALVGTVTTEIRARPDKFNVAFRFRWTPSPDERALFDRAAMRWQRVLRQAAPTTTSFPAGGCGPGTAAEEIIHQGVVIWVDRFDDGSVAPGVTGTAGPCVVDELGRTRVGAMALRRSFSTAVTTMTALERSAWESQFVHQLGQSFGLTGLTAFGVPRPELDQSVAGQPRWTGPAALAAYQAAGGTGAGVPITADFNFWKSDAGTAGDVMLPAVNAASRITRVSAGALADRGYSVDLSRAEPVPILLAPGLALRTVRYQP